MLKRASMVLVLLLALGVMVPGVLADEVTVEPGSPVKLGVGLGLSGEGIAPLGIDIQRGVELAQSDRPTVTVGGIEFEVTLDVQDAQCSDVGGQAVANRFVSDETIVAVIGHMCSSSCFASAPIYDSAGYTNISPSCTNPSLTLRGFTSFNRSVPSDGFQGSVAADFVYNELDIRRIATIHDGSPYGEGLVSVMADAFTELGGEVVAADAVTVGDTQFTSLLEDLASSDPELIYFGGFPAEAARLAQQRADAGLEEVLFMGADGILGTEFVALAGGAAEDAYASAPFSPTSDELDSFLDRYVETYNETPPAPYHANGYDAYNILLDAIEGVGSVDEDGNLVIDRAALADYVRSTSNFDGLTGRLDASGTGELVSAERAIVGLSQVQDGEFIQIVVIGGEDEEDALAGAITDIALADPEFSTLVEAVLLADPAIVTAISGAGPYTVFVPTNAAFEALGVDLMELETEALSNILLYHVVEGVTMADDLVEAGSGTFTTLLGQDVSFEVTDEGVVLNGSVMVTATDISASNGVIHVIDGVLVPEE